MRTSIFTTLLIVVFGTAAIMGCGKSDKSSSNNGYYCDTYGNCYSNNGNNSFNNQNLISENTVVFSGGLNILNGSAWGDVVKGLGVCGPRQSPNYFYFDLGTTLMCPYMNDAAPRVQIVFNDYKLPNSKTSGTFYIGSTSFQGLTFYVNWRNINQNSAIGTEMLLSQDPKNQYLKVVFSGKTTDSTAQVTLYYGSNMFSQGYISRIQ
ncbi:MAG: hypothetical protein A2Z20_10425 [Bdellovibrionales bacterium RBG_16_40_8]|nr:MAG: hypothetical protein A2Z20_10425 [Bdellovibrionales bacterium RBG_16_40_8]